LLLIDLISDQLAQTVEDEIHVQLI